LDRVYDIFSSAGYMGLLTVGAILSLTGCSDRVRPGTVGTAATSVGPAAWVYVQTNKGVNLYDAAADGKLTLAAGSPFSTTGTMTGSNGSHLITLGTDYVHSYAVHSNGTIGEQVSEINTQSYAGRQCGDNTGGSATLDHTGRNLYVMIVGNNCMAQQTLDVAAGSGDLSFSAATVDTRFPADAIAEDDCCTRLTITGNDAFAYTVSAAGTNWNSSLIGYRRTSTGSLAPLTSMSEADPTPQPGSGYTYTPPFAVEADPSGHLAALIPGEVDGKAVMQLASYTVESNGSVASTNTWENMPTVSASIYGIGSSFSPALSMSPAGNLLAVQIEPECQSCDTPWGFQLFHFNGANPVTTYSSVLLSNVMVLQMHWDTSNHLYILGSPVGSSSPNIKLYVYTVTATSIVEVSGSPYSIAGGENSMVVVSK
jgi:hypothetical protein